jgi:hypothetical protein
MGAETIPDRTARQTIKKAWMNLFRSCLIGDLIPRGQTGAARADYGRLGTPVYQWKNAHIAIGHFGPGDIQFWYDYNDDAVLPQGWMLCNGVIINETNYNAQHETGDWDTYIASSILDGKRLPDMDSKFIKAKTGSLQDGSIAITTVGANEFDFYHIHGTPTTTSSSGSTAQNINIDSGAKAYLAGHVHDVDLNPPLGELASPNIEPEYIEVKMLMRII